MRTSPARKDARRYADRTAAVGHIDKYDSVRSDGHVVSDANGTEQLRAGSDVDPVADLRRAALCAMTQAYRHAVADYAIVSKTRVAANHNAADVLDDEAPADVRFTRQFNPSKASAKNFSTL